MLKAQADACNKEVARREANAEAELKLLISQAEVVAEEVVMKKKAAAGAEIANAAAQIANLKSAIETGTLTQEQIVACRDMIFLLGMSGG